MDIEKVLNELTDTLKTTATSITESILNTPVFDKYKNSEDKVGDMLDDAGEFVNKSLKSISEQIDPTVDAVKKRVYDSFYEEYRKAGMPNGDTHEGFMQWTEGIEDRVRARTEKEINNIRTVSVNGFQKALDFITAEIAKISNDDDDNNNSEPQA